MAWTFFVHFMASILVSTFFFTSNFDSIVFNSILYQSVVSILYVNNIYHSLLIKLLHFNSLITGKLQDKLIYFVLTYHHFVNLLTYDGWHYPTFTQMKHF